MQVKLTAAAHHLPALVSGGSSWRSPASLLGRSRLLQQHGVQRGLYLRRAVLLWGAHRLSRQKGLIRRHMPYWQWFQSQHPVSDIAMCNRLLSDRGASDGLLARSAPMVERHRAALPGCGGASMRSRVQPCTASPRPFRLCGGAALRAPTQFVWKLGHSACGLDRDFRQQILCMSTVRDNLQSSVTPLNDGCAYILWVTPVRRQ